MKKILIEIFFILLGSFIFAVSINLFIIPNNLGEGGVTGLTIIFYYLFQWSPGMVNFVLNTFLLIIGYKFLSSKTIIYTIIAIVFNSLFLHLTMNWNISSDEILVNTIYGGVLSGIGVGLILRVGGTTAGSTILASITNKYLGWSVSFGILFFDSIVVLFSYFIIGIEMVMLTIIMITIAAKVIDFIIEGVNPKKAVTIISEKAEEIAGEVNGLMNRGVTAVPGFGYYSKLERNILYIVISKQEVVQLKKIVEACDPSSFITIHDVRDVFGKGFIDLNATKNK